MKFTCDTNVPVDVLRDPSAEEAFRVFLSRFSHLTYLSAVVILELRAGARTPKQVRLLEQEVIQRFSGVNRVFAPSADAFSAAGKLLATVATREGWTAEAHPSLVHDALLATSCRESGVTLITHDKVRAIQGPFARLAVRRAVAGSLPITASHPMTPLTRITIDPTAKRPPRSSRRSS